MKLNMWGNKCVEIRQKTRARLHLCVSLCEKVACVIVLNVRIIILWKKKKRNRFSSKNCSFFICTHTTKCWWITTAKANWEYSERFRRCAIADVHVMAKIWSGCICSITHHFRAMCVEARCHATAPLLLHLYTFCHMHNTPSSS